MLFLSFLPLRSAWLHARALKKLPPKPLTLLLKAQKLLLIPPLKAQKLLLLVQKLLPTLQPTQLRRLVKL